MVHRVLKISKITNAPLCCGPAFPLRALQDFADGQGRAAFHGLLRDLVRKPAAAGLEGAAAQKRREALEELSAQVLPEPADLADLVLGAVDAMVDYWGLLSDTAGQQEDSEEEKEEGDGPLEQQRWCCVLDALGMLLRQWPGRRSDASGIPMALVDKVEESVQSLVLAAAQHDQEPVRSVAPASRLCCNCYHCCDAMR